MHNYHVQLYQYNGPVLKNKRTQYINKLPQWNQLISGSNYIYYVVEYIIKNVMEIFFHSVCTQILNFLGAKCLVFVSSRCVKMREFSFAQFLYFWRSFQFLNDKIHNYVLFEIIVSLILQKLKNKHTFLKKYTNSAKEVSFAQRSKSSRILYFKIIALFSGDSWNLILFSWPSVLVVLCDKLKLRESRLLTFKQILSKALLLLKIAALFSCDSWN